MIVDLFIAAIIMIALIIIVAFAWYHWYGWKSFSYSLGNSVSFSPPVGSDVSKLRFKDCIFTVTPTGATAQSRDVSETLIGMAVAYRGSTNMPSTLDLVRPLNAFSFVITGFNDPNTVKDPTVAPWCKEPATTCTNGSKCENGNCDTVHGICLPCDGSPQVTLTGYYRVI